MLEKNKSGLKKEKKMRVLNLLKVDMPILTCIFFTFNWLTLTSEMHSVVASCLLSRGKRKYAPLGMRLLWKYIRNYFLVYQLISPFLVYLQNYKEFEAEILDLQSEKYGLSFDIKKYTTSGWALRDENVIGIRAFNTRGTNGPWNFLAYFDPCRDINVYFTGCFIKLLSKPNLTEHIRKHKRDVRECIGVHFTANFERLLVVRCRYSIII